MKRMQLLNATKRLGTAVAVLLCMVAVTAFAQVANLSQYTFLSGTCSEYDMTSGATILLGSGTDDAISGATNIGFTFTFGATSYTQFKANSNGYMSLGANASNSGCCGYNLTSIPSADWPVISMFSKDLHNGSDGYVSYKLFGTAPNRVLVVHWRTREYPGAGQLTHTSMQARLYETSNKIEMWYGTNSMTGTGGIGVLISNSNFGAVNSGVVSFSSASVSSFPAAGTCYSFTPCQANVAFTGNVAQGGTTNMAEGDTLLAGFQVMRGSQGQRTPFTLYNGTPALGACATRNYTYTISGTYASDYSITPISGTLTNGSSTIPTITFRPSGLGNRPATLRVTDDAGLSRTFNLRGVGVTRIRFSGNVAQGGTANVLTGDTLLNGTKVPFGSVRSFRPLTIENINSDPLSSPPANVTYTLNDPTGHYSITPVSAMLNSGQTSAVEISFTALGDVGYQEATLTVNADDEIRTYLLRAFNAAPGGELYEGGTRITGTNPLFVDRAACVGVDIISVQVTAYNTGAGDFIVYGASAYETDTVIGQGAPPYPLLHRNGQPITSIDYFLTRTPGVVPKSGNAAFDSIVIPEKGSSTFYVNMIASRPGRRYGEIFFRTNAFNMSDPNVDGVPTRGVLRTGLFGRGFSSSLSGTTPGQRPGAIIMNTTEVRESNTVKAWLSNSGECDLHISRSKFRVESGDVEEFKLLSVLPNTPTSGDDYVLAPGFKDSVVIQFSPKTYGSRRATIRLATNDSTLGDADIIERGIYYWDLFGKGSVGLEVRHAQLPPAVVDGPGSQGFIVLENTSGTTVEIQNLALVGGNGEIVQHAGQGWPNLPIILQPGQKIQLWVQLNATGVPGNRDADVEVTIQGGKKINVHVSGYAGTRLLSVLPGTLFNGVKVEVGDIVRQYVSVTNIGTLPIQLNDPTLGGTNPTDYRVNPLRRRVLEPGQTELVEVTYSPQAPGASSATLSFAGNGTNGTQVVNLGGEGTGTMIGTPGGPATGTSQENPGLTGAGKQNLGAGLALTDVLPNPARDLVRLNYIAGNNGGPVTIALYDMSGHQVLIKEEGEQTAGARVAELRVSDLADGAYHCVIKQGDRTVSQVIRVVR